MAIKVGNKEVANITVGSTPVKSVYKGSTKIWPTERWNVIYENSEGLVLNPNIDDTVIDLGQTSTESNKFRITYKYEFISGATAWFDNCYYRNPSKIEFTQETLPPQNTINTIEVERTSPTAKGVNLFSLGCNYRYNSNSYIQSVSVRLHAQKIGLLVGYPTRNGSNTDFDYSIKMTIYKVEQYK